MTKRRQPLLLAGIAVLLSALPAAAQNPDLTYHPVAPCRFFDTRSAVGPFAAYETRSYVVTGSGSFAGQGGSATGCNVPGPSAVGPQVQAVEVNFIVIAPAATGFLSASEANGTPTMSVINFTANQTIADTGTIAVAQSGSSDIKVRLLDSGAHVVGTVVGYYSKAMQTVYVHPTPGSPTANGTTLLSYLNSITSASATVRYVLKLEPGIYDLGTTMLQMKPYVDIEGSGQQATVIQGQGNNDSGLATGIVQGASSSELRNLQIQSTGSTSLPVSIGVFVPDGADTRIKNVTIVSTGPQFNAGIRARYSSPTIEDVTISIQGGANGYGITAFGDLAAPVIERAKISVTGSTNGQGLFSGYSGKLTNLRDLQVTVSGGSNGYGIRFGDGTQDLTLTNSKIVVQGSTSQSKGVELGAYGTVGAKVEQSQIRASGSGVSYGLTGGSTVSINHSEITAATNTVLGSGGTFIGATQLSGGPASSATCAGVYDESYVFTAGPACP